MEESLSDQVEQPLLRVMAEAETDEICDRVVGKIARLIQSKYGVEEES